MLRDFFLGFVRTHVLHHASREPVYGLQLIAELRRHGYDLSPGTLYPMLHDLGKSGYLGRELTGLLRRLIGFPAPARPDGEPQSGSGRRDWWHCPTPVKGCPERPE